MSTFIKDHIESFKRHYPVLANHQDYHVFTEMCIKYFYFGEGNSFDQDIAKTWLTDGANDGGIDAIINDPSSEGNDVVIIQSKYYENTVLDSDAVAAEFVKIKGTIKDLRNNKVAEYNDNVVTAFRNATSQMEDDGEIRVVLFTSYQPNGKREYNKLEKTMRNALSEYECQINCGSDIESEIEICENGNLNVDFDKLKLDKKDNYLEYEDSVIVNISAQVLQDLYTRRRNGLLGRNLRYYVRQKAVDTGIADTIARTPENFWYKNNGVVIVCDDFEIDGTEIKLTNFSIVNGGQTTNRISQVDISKDFFLQCKVVKTKGESEEEKDTFILGIADATNSQKPIKPADLKANTPEQLKLRLRLNNKGVYYITKKGDKTPKQYAEPYQSTKMETVGKLSLASTLQMPGSARANSKRMFNDEYYYLIFGNDAKEGVIADLLRISYYYDRFLKADLKSRGYDERSVLPMIKNGRTFQYACISLLCKINYGTIDYSAIASSLNDTDTLKKLLRKMDGTDCLVTGSIQNEEDVFFSIFDIIGDEVLGYCFGNALDQADSEQKALAASDYLKKDSTYYKDIIKRLWTTYNRNSVLKQNIDLICGKYIESV